MNHRALVDWKKFKIEYFKIQKEFEDLKRYFPKNKWIEIPLNLYPWDFLNASGVYVIFSYRNKSIYIGSSINIGQRLLSHIDINGKFRETEKVSKIKIKLIDFTYGLCGLERKLIFKIKPKYNQQFKNKKSRTYKIIALG